MTGRVHLYEAAVTWTGNLGQGTSKYSGYDRSHVARVDGKPDLALSADPAFLGNRAMYNPEELLVVAMSSCHMLWYLHLCANAKIRVVAYEDRPSGRLIESKDGKGHFESILLRPSVTIETGDVQEARRLHQDAHEACFIANSVNFPVILEPSIQQVSKA
jgi:organic hydroperoxide reductase OsmC/OhrA